MHTQSTSPKIIVSAITESLRGFRQRRGERRSYPAESFAGAGPPTAQSPSPPRAPASPVEPAEDMSPFRPSGYVEMNGRAIPVMDPVFLQALQAQVAQGMVPPSFLIADLMGPGAHLSKATTADPQAAAAVHGATDPENMSASPPPGTNASPGEHAAPRTEEIASESPGEHAAPRTEPITRKTPDAKHGSAAPEPSPAQFERQLDRREGEEICLGTLLREHEQRLAEQAEAAAKQQAALLREVLAAHRTEQAEQASRHTQVIRDLLREHQNQLDDRANAAITREVQAIGTLLREHREALVDAHEAHRRDLEEVLESHRDELQAARGIGGGDDKFRELLAEQAKQQNAAHLQLAAVVQRLAERVQEFADQAAKQRADLSWLPPPPSFVPPLPAVPTAPIASSGTPATPNPPWPVQAMGPSQSSAVETVAKLHRADAGKASIALAVGEPVFELDRSPRQKDASSSSSPTTAPANTPHQRLSAAARRISQEHDRHRVDELMDEVHLADPGCDDDDDVMLAAPPPERSPERCLRPTP